MDGLSENAKAFRAGMDGLVQEHAADARAVERSWRDTAAAADKSAQEQTQNAQKLISRVQERADSMESKEEENWLQQIGDYEDDESEEVDPEVEHFSQQLVAGRQAVAAEAAPTAEPAHQESSQWQAKAGRFGGQATPPPEPPTAPEPPAPAPRSAGQSRSPWDEFDDDFDDEDWLR